MSRTERALQIKKSDTLNAKTHFSHFWYYTWNAIRRLQKQCHMCEWVMSYVWRSHVTRMNESRCTYEWSMPHMWIWYDTTYKKTHMCFCNRRIAFHVSYHIRWMQRMCESHRKNTYVFLVSHRKMCFCIQRSFLTRWMQKHFFFFCETRAQQETAHSQNFVENHFREISSFLEIQKWAHFRKHGFLWDVCTTIRAKIRHLFWIYTLVNRGLCFVKRVCMCGVAHSCVTCLIHVWHDLFMFDMVCISLTWLIHVWHDPLRSNSCIENSRVTWLSDLFGMTHSCVTSLNHVCRASLLQTFWNERLLLWQRHTYRCDKLQNIHTDATSCSLYI